MVLASYFDYTIADVPECHLLKSIGVKHLVRCEKILVRHGEWWVHTIGGERLNSFFFANFAKLIAVNRANAEHFLLLNRKLFILAFISG